MTKLSWEDLGFESEAAYREHSAAERDAIDEEYREEAELDTMTTTRELTTGYVACNYTDGDTLGGVDHAEVRETAELAMADVGVTYDGVRYVHTDGYLYVDRPE